jgi:hypothetical protein
MKAARMSPDAPRIQAAVAELQGLIQQHYPTATCEVSPGDDPVGTYLIVTVDVEDTDAVVDVYIDRLLAFQIEEGLAVYVGPSMSPPRVC